MTRREQFVLGFLALALLTGSVTIFALRSTSPEPATLVVQPDATRDPQPVVSPHARTSPEQPPEIVVSIQGAVANPGVYRVDEGLRVNDLVAMAGGLVAFADTSQINLAARVVDGTTLTVPSRRRSDAQESSQTTPTEIPAVYAVTAPAGIAAFPASSGARLINLNTATQQELETLPGIGPKLAQEIITYRSVQPFTDVADLDNVSGIGDAKLASVRDLVTVR